MKPGKPPKPVKLRVLEGGRTSRIVREMRKTAADVLPQASDKYPSRPKVMSKKGSQQWDFVCGLIDEMGLLSRTDTIAIQLLCEAYADYLNAIEAINKNGGETYQTQTSRGKGVIVRNIPAVRQRNDADYRIRSWLNEFGMTPSARSRVRGNGKNSEEDPAEKYFGRG